MSDNVKILTADQMRKKYGEFYETAGKLSFERESIPVELWPLIPYAEVWGISDDLCREELVNKAPRMAIDDLSSAIEQFDDEMDEWLAGDEADNESPSEEYIAFSAMRMAADFA